MLKPTSIRQRFVWGYALPLCITVSGIALGLAVGKHNTDQALKNQEAAIAERKLLDSVRVQFLAYRPTKAFLPHLNDDAALQAEGKNLYQLLKKTRKLTAQHQDIHVQTREPDSSSVVSQAPSHSTHNDTSLRNDAGQGESPAADAGSSRASDSQEKNLSTLSAQNHEALHDTFDSLQALLIALEHRTQAFVDEVSALTDGPNRQVLAEQALLNFAQSSEFDRLLTSMNRLDYFVEQLDIQEMKAQNALNRAFWLQTWIIISSLLISVLIASLIAWRNSRAIAQPLLAVTEVARYVTEASDFDLRAPVYGQDEVGTLAEALNCLIEQVQQLLEEVNGKNSELSAALNQLEEQHVQLVQSEKMSSLGQLVAGVAHEINNPVNFIHGNISHIKDHVDDVMLLVSGLKAHYPEEIADIESIYDNLDLDFIQEDLGKILGSMRVGTERIRDIVLSLRNFSRLDEASCKTVDLHEGLASTLMILQHRLKATPERRAIDVVHNYGNLPQIECYPGQLNQVILNLLTNAIDAIEERAAKASQFPKQPPFKITITTHIYQTHWVEIAISDTGIGMSEIVQQRLFEKFFTTKPVGVGTGIGMSISHQIITETHHGELTFESTSNVGTTFFVRIPVKQIWQASAPPKLSSRVAI